MPTTRRRRSLLLLGLFLVGLLAASVSVALARRPSAQPGSQRAGVLEVVAAENFWGSIVSQIGGAHVRVESIITNPGSDPHDYEPTPSDARAIASAALVILNGLGYDPWASSLLAAEGAGSRVLDVGHLLGLPNGSNPHRWYDPADVRRVVDATVRELSGLDPSHAASYRAGGTHFLRVALGPYDRLVATIRSRFAGSTVGASESIFSLLAPALRLHVLTPSSFLRAVSEGTEVSAADRETIDRQIADHRIRIYVVNSQKTTPDVEVQLAACRRAGIPIAGITETLSPAGATYEAWQTGELRGVLAALTRSAGGRG